MVEEKIRQLGITSGERYSKRERQTVEGKDVRMWTLRIKSKEEIRKGRGEKESLKRWKVKGKVGNINRDFACHHNSPSPDFPRYPVIDELERVDTWEDCGHVAQDSIRTRACGFVARRASHYTTRALFK